MVLLKLLLALFLTIIFSGCQSLRPPTDSKSTLLLGKVIFKAVQVHPDSNSWGISPDPNGIYTSPITVTLTNSDGSKDFEISTSNNGIFVSNALPAGIYFLKRLKVIYYPVYQWSYFTVFGHNKQIIVKAGTVTNIGILDWYFTSNPTDNKKYIADLFSNRDYELVKKEFLDNHDSQKWNAVSWTNVPIDQSYNN
jgi:uncharacterized protein YceK